MEKKKKKLYENLETAIEMAENYITGETDKHEIMQYLQKNVHNLHDEVFQEKARYDFEFASELQRKKFERLNSVNKGIAHSRELDKISYNDIADAVTQGGKYINNPEALAYDEVRNQIKHILADNIPEVGQQFHLEKAKKSLKKIKELYHK